MIRSTGRPTATDRVLAAYCAAAVLLLVADGHALGDRRLALAAGHALVAGLALALGFADRGGEGGFVRFVHRWLPLVAIAWLYGWAGEMRDLLVGHDLDRVIVRWDDALFPGHWYALGARLPLPAIEAAHAVYFSYYLLLFVPALAAGRRAARAVDRYLFWLTTALLAHFALALAFPVAGPLAVRRATMPAGVFFVPLMDGFYGAFDRGGLAFPSTHVVAAMIAAFFAGRRFFPRATWAYAFWFAAIAASTVLCGYHYPIDVAAGLVTGSIFVALAARRAPDREEAPPVGDW